MERRLLQLTLVVALTIGVGCASGGLKMPRLVMPTSFQPETRAPQPHYLVVPLVEAGLHTESAERIGRRFRDRAFLAGYPVTLVSDLWVTRQAELERTRDFEHFFHAPKEVPPEQIEPGLLTPVIGNTYAGAALVGATAVLDIAKPGQRILVTSYGSGAGSDAFILRVTDAITERQGLAPTTQDYIDRREEIDYGMYVRLRGKLAR